jgi:hypothetical protein
METLLTRFDFGELIALTAVLGGLVTGLVTIVAVFWHKIRKAEIDSRLKIEMLNRGMSVAEIEAVLAAGKTASDE